MREMCQNASLPLSW